MEQLEAIAAVGSPVVSVGDFSQGPRLTAEEFLSQASDDAIAALRAGKNVQHGAYFYTGESLGISADSSIGMAADAGRMNVMLQKQNADLLAALVEEKKKVADLTAAASKAPDAAELATVTTERDGLKTQVSDLTKERDKLNADLLAAKATPPDPKAK